MCAFTNICTPPAASTQYRGKRHLVGKAGPQSCWDALAQVGIIEDDCRVFASQLQRKLFAVRSALLRDPLGCECASREGDEGHVRMADEGFSCLGACPKHHIHHPVWHPSWKERHKVSTPSSCSAGFSYQRFISGLRKSLETKRDPQLS